MVEKSNEWRLVSIGDVVEVKNELEHNPKSAGLERYLKVEHLDPESLRIKRWGMIEDGDLPPTFYKVFRKRQVLYPTRNPHLRRTAYADFDGICGEKTLTLEAKRDYLIPELLPFLFQQESFIRHATSNMIGSTNPHIRWRDIASYKFLLPPKDEQRRITGILWAADDAVQTFQSSAKEATTAQAVYLESWLSESSQAGTYLSVLLDDVCTIQNGQVDPTVPPFSNMIHLAPDDMESRTGRILEMKTAAQDGVSSGNYAFTEDAIIYSKIRPNLRKVAFPKFAGVCSADMYPVYPKPNILPEMLFYILLSEGFTSYATANSVRSAIPKLNRQAMLRYTFKLPHLDEQEQLLAILRSFSASINSLGEQISSLQAVKKHLLSNLLRQ